jgi:hypothetical protein
MFDLCLLLKTSAIKLKIRKLWKGQDRYLIKLLVISVVLDPLPVIGELIDKFFLYNTCSKRNLEGHGDYGTPAAGG